MHARIYKCKLFGITSCVMGFPTLLLRITPQQLRGLMVSAAVGTSAAAPQRIHRKPTRLWNRRFTVARPTRMCARACVTACYMRCSVVCGAVLLGTHPGSFSLMPFFMNVMNRNRSIAAIACRSRSFDTPPATRRAHCGIGERQTDRAAVYCPYKRFLHRLQSAARRSSVQ